MMLALLLALQADLADAIRKTRAEKSYEVTFTSRTTIGRGDPLDRKGTVRWWKAGALIVEYEGSLGESVRAVRAGTQYKCAQHEPVFKPSPCETCGGPRAPTTYPRVWVLHLGKWRTADEASKPWAASGFQNPDELLGLMETQAGAAKPTKGGWTLVLSGKEAIQIARKLASGNDFAAEDATLKTDLTIDQGRIVSLEIDARVTSTDGTASVTGSARLAHFSELTPPARLGKVEFSPEIAEALTQQLR